MGFHNALILYDIHQPYAWGYANAGIRNAATGFVSADVGKIARQVDDNSLWLLTYDVTPTWLQLTGQYRKTDFAEIIADTTTTSTSFVDLLTVAITTTANGSLVIEAAASGDNASTAITKYRLTVDGVQVAAAAVQSGASIWNTAALMKKYAVAAGAHTVKLQWLVSAGTGRIRPVTAPNSDYASLVVKEVGA